MPNVIMAMDECPLGLGQADDASTTFAHCRRLAALAIEVSRLAGFPALLKPMIEDAVRFHSVLEAARPRSPLGRLAWNIACERESDDRTARTSGLQGTLAGLLRLCNLVDERIEALQFDYKDLDAILDEIQSFAPLEGFDPALVQHLRDLRCRLPQRVKHGDVLPVEASTARRVFLELGPEREYDIQELAAVAVRDPVLAASLIRVANSSLYAPAARFSRVSKAIAYVGTAEARKVMLAAVLRPLFASAGLTRLWTHSVSAAQLCSALAAQTGCVAAEEGLMLGLVHDFGALAIQFAPRETRDVYARLVQMGCPVTYVERLLFGCDHGEIGAGILTEWKFSDDLVEAVRFHHQPERSECALTAFIYLVEFWSGLDEDLPSFHRVKECLFRTGLSLEVLAQAGSKGNALETLRSLA